MIYVTISEFKNNMDYYLELSKKVDVLLTENDEVVTVLMNPDKHQMLLINSLAGSLGKVDENIDYKQVLIEALEEKMH